MKSSSLVFTALALAACSSGPVDPAVSANKTQAGDSGATGLAAPANAAAAEANQRASAPLASDGMAWRFDAVTASASFGPVDAEPQLSIGCRGGVLHITRHAAADGNTGTLSFTGNGQAASLPVSAAPSQLGPSGLSTATLDPGDMTNAVARVFVGPGPVQITLGGAPSLLAPPSDAPRRVFAACR